MFIDNFKKTYYMISPDIDIESETIISTNYMTESEYENKISLLNKCGYKSLNIKSTNLDYFRTKQNVLIYSLYLFSFN